MPQTAIIAIMLLTACATSGSSTASPAKAEAAPAAAAPAAAPSAGAVSVEFASPEATKAGGVVTETKYSERAGDVEITKKEFAGGVVTLTGQVGVGKGSSYFGIGINFPINADGKPIDGRAYKTVTFQVASTTARALRLRVSGADEKVRNSGCYPVYVQEVTKEVKAYTIPLSKFASESWCAANSKSVDSTLTELYGFEVADTTASKGPTVMSVGTITLNP